MSAARHERFYWELVTFQASRYEPASSMMLIVSLGQVDNTLYKVPKQQFVTGSSFFRDLFQLPQGDGVVEGRDDEHPIHLPGDVTKDEFEILIRAVCSSALYAHWHIITTKPHLIVIGLAVARILDSSAKMIGCVV